MVIIPQSDIEWLYRIREKYGVQLEDNNKVYDVDILPSTLYKWVKKKSYYTDYINMGPQMGIPNGMIWRVWGWNSLPKKSTLENVEWEDTIQVVHTL